MKKPLFTPEELAEMAAFDAEVEKRPLTNEEVRLSLERDRLAKRIGKDNADYKRADYQRRYREANREEIADYQRRYYEANREEIADYQSEYYSKGSDEKAAMSPMRFWRKMHNYSQRMLAEMLGVTQPHISHWERGVTPIPKDVMNKLGIEQ